DEDIFYPSFIIENLLKEYKEYPDCIICTRGYSVVKNKNNISSYNNWELLYRHYAPSSSIFHTSGGGTLYNPSTFIDDVLDKDVFLEHCKYADDIWLNIQAQRSNILTVKTKGYIEV